jgi:outer membrane protein assembly factor BamE (lipoprotein component of BamABCDE complex)
MTLSSKATRFSGAQYWNLAMLLLLVSTLFPTGCTTFSSDKGVVNKWRDPSLAPFKPGRTTESDVVEALGPPSQLIGLNDETIYYYLYEKRKGRGLILILYNSVKETIAYDRAIFRFDDAGVLLDYGYSLEALPYEEQGRP